MGLQDPSAPGEVPGQGRLGAGRKSKAHALSQEFPSFGLGKKEWLALKNSRTAARSYVSIQPIQEAIKPS
jgi:hypothetical protein